MCDISESALRLIISHNILVFVMPSEKNELPQSLTGQLLIAMPNMGDPRFERTVIYICSHSDDHAMGVIVNRLMDEISFEEMLDQLDIDFEDSQDVPVFFGGPVQTERGLVIHSLDYSSDQTLVLSERLGLTATKEILHDIANATDGFGAPQQYLLAIGHAGWAGGQLESELAMNVWAHCPADEAIIFNNAKEDAWRLALQKLGIDDYHQLSGEWSSVRRDDEPLN